MPRFRTVDPATLPKHFDAAAAERRWAEEWERSGAFRWDPARSREEALLRVCEEVVVKHPYDFVTIVLPGFVPARRWHHGFHNQRALLLKGALLFRPNVVVTSVPFHLNR